MFRLPPRTLNRPPVRPDLRLGPATCVLDRLRLVAWSTQSLEVALVVRTALGLGRDVIDVCGWCRARQAGLAQMLVALEDAAP